MSIADKLTTIAENEQKVYDKGVADGKQSEYDAFWDKFQNYGKRTNYDYLLGGDNVSRSWFKPKYDIKPTSMYMFTYQNYGLGGVDFVEWFKELGVSLDTSRCASFQYAFFRGKRYGVIDTTATTILNVQVFWGNKSLTTIDELIVKETTQYSSLTFENTPALANIKISGTIGRSFTMSSSPLNVKSAKSVINALKNYAGTDKELTYKLTLKSTVWTALNNAETPPTGDTWQEYVQSLGWLYA